MSITDEIYFVNMSYLLLLKEACKQQLLSKFEIDISLAEEISKMPIYKLDKIAKTKLINNKNKQEIFISHL